MRYRDTDYLKIRACLLIYLAILQRCCSTQHSNTDDCMLVCVMRVYITTKLPSKQKFCYIRTDKHKQVSRLNVITYHAYFLLLGQTCNHPLCSVLQLLYIHTVKHTYMNLSTRKAFNPSGSQTGIFLDNAVNTMAPCVTRTLVDVELTTEDNRVGVFREEISTNCGISVVKNDRK